MLSCPAWNGSIAAPALYRHIGQNSYLMKRLNMFFRKILISCLGLFSLILFAVMPGLSVSAEQTEKIEAQIVTDKGMEYSFQLELAHTPKTRAKGLMHRQHLAENGGMLFIWPETATRLFWMKNTPVSLDILFFDQTGRLVYLHPSAVPYSLQTISSLQPVKYVVEIKGGYARRHAIEAGAYLNIITDMPPAE